MLLDTGSTCCTRALVSYDHIEVGERYCCCIDRRKLCHNFDSGVYVVRLWNLNDKPCNGVHRCPAPTLVLSPRIPRRAQLLASLLRWNRESGYYKQSIDTVKGGNRFRQFKKSIFFFALIVSITIEEYVPKVLKKNFNSFRCIFLEMTFFKFVSL